MNPPALTLNNSKCSLIIITAQLFHDEVVFQITKTLIDRCMHTYCLLLLNNKGNNNR
jgi:hypothetical protein